jgi:hypothetical protein
MADQIDVKVTATTSDFKSGMSDAASHTASTTDDMRSSLGRLGSAFEGVGGQVLLVNEALELMGKVFEGVKRLFEGTIGAVISHDLAMRNLAVRYGDTTEEMSRFAFASQQAGVDADELGRTVRILQQRLEEAATKSGDARANFEAVGISSQHAGDLMKQGATAQLLAVVDAFAQYDAGAQRNVIANELLGRGYQTLNLLIAEGPEAMRQWLGQARVVSDQEAKTAKEMEDAWGSLGNEWKKLMAELFGGGDTIRFIGNQLGWLGDIVGFLKDGVHWLADEWRQLVGWMSQAVNKAAEYYGFAAPFGETTAPLAEAGGMSLGASGGSGTKGAPTPPPKATDVIAAQKQVYDHLRTEEATALADAAHNADLKLAIARAYSEEVRRLFGAQSEEYQKQLLTETTAFREANDQRLKLAIDGLQQETKAQTDAIALQKLAVQGQFERGLITKQAEIDALIDLENQRYAIIKASIDQERVLQEQQGVRNPVAESGLAGRAQGAQQENAVNLSALTQQKLEEELSLANIMRTTLTGVFEATQQAVDRSINGMIQGTTKLKDAVRNVGQSILGEFVNMGIKMVATWIKDHAIMVAVEWAAQTEITAASVVGWAERLAVELAATIKSIYMAAARAAAAVWAALTKSFGYIGAILGIAAAAVVFAGITAYAAISAEGGADLGNESPVAQLHPREMVLPAEQANVIRTLAASGSYQSGGVVAGGGGKATPVEIASTRHPVAVTDSGTPITTSVHKVHGQVAVAPANGTAMPVQNVGNQKMEVFNHAGTPLFTHEVQMAGGLIAEVSDMGQGYGTGGGGGTGSSGGGGGGFAHGGEVDRDQISRLHFREMVLSPELADRVRTMTEPGGGTQFHATIYAMDGASVKRVLMENRRELWQAMRRVERERNGARP